MHERTTVRKKTGLRTQMMTLMLILCTLALLIQGCLLIYASVRFYSEKAYDDMEFFLQTCNSNFSSKMLYVEGVVNNLRGDPMMQSFFSDEGFNWVEIRSQFEFCTNIVSEQNLIDSREPFVSEIYLFNRNGNYLRENYYSLPNDEQKAHDRYYEALFEAFSDGEPVIRHTLTEQTLYLFAPFYDQRMQVCGMFAAGIDRTALEQLLGEIDRYDDAFCVLLGADAGLSIQHNCVLPEESLERFLTLEGGLQSFSLDGTQYLLMPGSRSFHLRTIAAVPQRQVYSTVAPLLRLLVCLIVVLVPLAAAAVSVAVWKSTKPVQAMTDKIRLFGKGELDVQMEPTGVAEYDEMAAVFNVMTGKIHSLIGQIAENQLLAAQLQIRYLQSQINPHFLFNSLNTISYFCREKPEKARELLLALSSYFRSMLEDTDYMVTLDTELEHVKAYTMLEEARFEKRLSIEINADPEALRSCVPNLILQPIVENAVHHGAMQREKGVGKVIVNVKREERSTRIDVIDNGPGMDYRIVQSLYGGEKVEHTGIGMMNVQQRLISLYGKSYGLQIVTSEEGTDVRMNIPDSAAGSAQQEKTPG